MLPPPPPPLQPPREELHVMWLIEIILDQNGCERTGMSHPPPCIHIRDQAFSLGESIPKKKNTRRLPVQGYVTVFMKTDALLDRIRGKFGRL